MAGDISTENFDKGQGLLTDSQGLLGQVAAAQIASGQAGGGGVRATWLEKLSAYQETLLQVEMAETKPLLKMAEAEAEFAQIKKAIYDKTIAAGTEWSALLEKVEAERARLMEGTSPAGLYALEILDKEFDETQKRIDAVSLDIIIEEDFLTQLADFVAALFFIHQDPISVQFAGQHNGVVFETTIIDYLVGASVFRRQQIHQLAPG